MNGTLAVPSEDQILETKFVTLQQQYIRHSPVGSHEVGHLWQFSAGCKPHTRVIIKNAENTSSLQ